MPGKPLFSNISRTLLLVLLVVTLVRIDKLAASDEPKSGFYADFLAQLDQAQKQVLSLEGAVPQEKFTWRPAEGVRSISEVYLHIVDGNYLLMSIAGAKPPVDMKVLMDQKAREGATTDKAKIADALKASYEWAKKAVASMSDADLEKMVDFFGRKITVRNALITVLNHNHEHLGQSIAYARMNGVVPPWTAEMQSRIQSQMKKDQEKAGQKKD